MGKDCTDDSYGNDACDRSVNREEDNMIQQQERGQDLQGAITYEANLC